MPFSTSHIFPSRAPTLARTAKGWLPPGRIRTNLARRKNSLYIEGDARTYTRTLYTFPDEVVKNEKKKTLIWQSAEMRHILRDVPPYRVPVFSRDMPTHGALWRVMSSEME